MYRARALVRPSFAAGLTTLALAAPAPAPAAPKRDLTVGSHGSRVAAVQRVLGLDPDGVFGRRTRAAVRSFQSAHALPPTGRVDLATARALWADRRARAGAPAAATPRSAPAGTEMVAAPGDAAAKAVEAAHSQQGTPYRSGGTEPGGFDCSGLTMWAYGQAGVELPHSSFGQYELGTAVDRGAIQAGDLVFFSTAGSGASDVAIATGPTTVISATTHGVMEHQTFDEYWGAHYVGARRLG